jgi:hypothetical protein
MARHSRGRRHSKKMGGRRHSRKHVSRKHSRKMGGRRHSRKHASRKSRRHMKRGGQQAHQQQTAFCLTPVAFNAPAAPGTGAAASAAPAQQGGGTPWF